MSLGILGNKVGMTQIFDASGDIIPVTIIKVGPCIITQIKTSLTDGYNSIQLGYDVNFKKSLNKPQSGHLKKYNNLVKTVYCASAAIRIIKQAIAVIGHKRTFTKAYRSQNKCIKKAIIKPAFKNINIKIKDHLNSP